MFPLIVLVIGCQEPAGGTAPQQVSGRFGRLSAGVGIQIPAIVPLAGDIPEQRLRTALVQRGAQPSDAELVEAIRSANGRAWIGFKPVAAPHTRDTQIIPAITRAAALEAREQVLRLPGVELLATFTRSASIVVRIPAEIVPLIRSLPIVNFVEAAPAAHLSSQTTPWGISKIGAPVIWSLGNRGEHATISILDTGSDEQHLGSELPPTADCYYYQISSITSCLDDFGHGSHVAGIAMGQDNAAGIVGTATAPNRFLSFKVCDMFGDCWQEAIVGALMWLEANLANWPRNIVNMSLGYGTNAPTDWIAVMERLYDAGVLLVASAGNHKPDDPAEYRGVEFPASHADVIAVSGTLEDDTFASSFFCDREFNLDVLGASN
jgi:subtilisin family serine protease